MTIFNIFTHNTLFLCLLDHDDVYMFPMARAMHGVHVFRVVRMKFDFRFQYIESFCLINLRAIALIFFQNERVIFFV